MVTYGLTNTSDNSAVPLKNISIFANIRGYVACVEATLTYRNESDNPIEALFTFPLDDQSAVFKFEAEIEGRLIIGECQEKEQAQQTYDDALAAGQSAFLLKESDAMGDVFECSVGNLPPKTDALLRFAYVIELCVQPNGSLRFVYPAVLGGRYGSPPAPIPANPEMGTSSIAGRRGTKKVVAPKVTYTSKDALPYTVDFKAVIEWSSGVHYVLMEDAADTIYVVNTAPKHDLCEVTLTSVYQFDHDLVMLVWFDAPFEPHIVMETPGLQVDVIMKEPVAMVNFCPNLQGELPVSKGEYIFVVDRSGSMYGDLIKQAKAALTAFIQGLPNDCYFNVLSFGSSFSLLFGASKKKTNKSLKEAEQLCQEMDANMGGTEMFQAFDHLYKMKLIDEYRRQVFLLTDGGIWNTTQLVGLVKRHNKTTRVFTFGIGDGVSTALVKGVARAGRGKAQFITNNLSQLAAKVGDTLHCAMQPNVEDVRVEWNLDSALHATVLPTELPPIFMGERLILYAIISSRKLTKNISTAGSVTLRCRLNGKEVMHKLELTVDREPQTDTSLPIHRLAAKAQIKELEINENEDNKSHKSMIELLSRSSNIVSKYTAYVGVDKGRVEKVVGDRVQVNIPLAERQATRKPKGKGKKRKRVMSSSDSDAEDSSLANAQGAFVLKAKPKRPAMRPAVVSSAPTLYGGGTTTAQMADKYINGKTPSLLPGAVSSRVKHRKHSHKKAFTHRKTNKYNINVNSQQFAQWSTDGFYYPVFSNKLSNNPESPKSKVSVRFLDGQTAALNQTDLLSACVLCAGDIIGVQEPERSFLHGVVLEYCSQTDTILCAQMDGQVLKHKPSYFVLPPETARAMMSRTTGNFDKKTLCSLPGLSNNVIELTTSDLAELAPDGWINENLVETYLSHIIHCLPDGCRRQIHMFSPAMFDFLQLSVVLDGSTKTRQSCSNINLDVINDHLLDFSICGKEFIFVPVFEEVHFYVIGVRLEAVQIAGCASYKAQFVVMDSYWADDRYTETVLLKGLLLKVAQQEGISLTFDPIVIYPPTPAQRNLSDCGVHMLLNIKHTIKDNLKLSCGLDWYPLTATSALRQELAAIIMCESTQQGAAHTHNGVSIIKATTEEMIHLTKTIKVGKWFSW